MPTNFGSFASGLDEAARIPDRKILEIQLRIARFCIERILARTPIDTGRLISNWQVTIGVVPSGEPLLSDPLSEALSELLDLGPFQVVHVTNNTPYAEVVEHGEFEGDGPRTIGGFSTQSPDGMVAITVVEAVERFS